MTAKRLKKGATYDDLVRVPENFVAEMFDGELYASPRPALPHAFAAIALVVKLGGPFGFDREPGGWLMLAEPELHFGNDVLVPDLAAWRRERLPSVPDDPYLTLAPDWVCEVLSPSTETIDRGRKLGIYAREGVPHVWLVDPLRQSLEVLALESGSLDPARPLVGRDGQRALRRRQSSRLEEFFDEIAHEESIPIFCSFLMDKFDSRIYDEAFGNVCRTHSHVIPAADYAQHQATVDRAIADVVGDIRWPLLTSLATWDEGPTTMPASQALVVWLKVHMPERFDAVLERARELEVAETRRRP